MSQSRTQSLPVRRVGAGHEHLTCERAYSGYEIANVLAGTLGSVWQTYVLERVEKFE